MKQSINNYLEAHEFAWSDSTYRSRRSRLTKAAPLITGDPQKLYNGLECAPYTKKTTFIIVGGLWQWLHGENPYKAFMKTYRQLFINAYEKEFINVSFECAKDLLNNIKEVSVREHANFLLHSGVRLNESYNTYQRGECLFVTGKASKVRQVFADPPKGLVPKGQLYLALKGVGLKPHSLRKLFATKLVKSGMSLHEVCKVMGWSNLNTAMSYLQASQGAELGNQVQGALRG